jgi:hypothetical protein
MNAKADNTTVQEYTPVMFDGFDSYDPDGTIKSYKSANNSMLIIEGGTW